LINWFKVLLCQQALDSECTATILHRQPWSTGRWLGLRDR